MTRLTRPTATTGVVVAALLLGGCSLGGDPEEAAEGSDVSVATTAAEGTAAGGSDVQVSQDQLPRSEVSLAPADPGSEIEVVDELPMTELRDGSSVGETSVEVRVGELLGDLETRDSTGGETVVVLTESILFDFDEAELREGSGPSLQQVAELISLSGDDEVRVVGHTDSEGNPEYNLDLSQQRAEAVLGALVAQGVAADRLLPEGRGQTEPVAENTQADGSDNPEGRAANRRVEVLIDDLPGQD